jgi:Sugar kinases, ribokinase family
MMPPRVLVVGEVLIDWLPDQAGPIETVEHFTRRAGGAPANVAVGLMRLEVPTALCANVSTDPFGSLLVDRLDAEGVDLRWLTRDATHPTAHAFITHETTGERSFSFCRADTADCHLDTTVVDTEALADLDAVVIGGVALAVEPARSAVFGLLERVPAATTVIFDPNLRPELWRADPAPVLRRAVAAADIVKLSAEEVDQLSLVTDPSQLLEMGADTVVWTAGGAGAEMIGAAGGPWGEGRWAVDGESPGAVVDTTGAGDAFLAGLVTGLLEGHAAPAALALANRIGAAATTAAGAMAALPDRSVVDT